MLTRFAPSPTGYLHLGHAASAQAAFGFAAKHGGTCLLRIEDIDRGRCRPEYQSAIIADLSWLGFRWPQPVRVQSEHFGQYQKLIDDLDRRGLIYRCFKTRKEIAAQSAHAPHGRPLPYIRTEPLPKNEEAKLLASGHAFAWRLSLAACRNYLGPQFDQLSFGNNGETIIAKPEIHGDVILARKDTPTSYHLASCADDALQGITHIVRGEDLLESTHIHRLLHALFDWPVPQYHHHRLLTDAAGARLAKRNKALALNAMRAAGASPQEILARSALPMTARLS